MKQNFYRVDRVFWNAEENKWVGDMGWSFGEFQIFNKAVWYDSLDEFIGLVKKGAKEAMKEDEADDNGLISCFILYTQEHEDLDEKPEYHSAYLACSKDMADRIGIEPKQNMYYVD